MLPTTVVPEDGAPPLPRVAAPLARRFQQVCATRLAEAIAGEERRAGGIRLAIALEIEPGGDQRRLAEAMGIDPSNASLVVERLHSMGLVERRINGVDRRARELYLTPKGKALWRRLRVKAANANDRVLEPLAPHERELLLDLLIRVIEGNWAHARPGGGRRKRGSQQSSTSKKGGQYARYVRFAVLPLLCCSRLRSHRLQACGQTWPQRTVRLIVPLPPGSGTDLVGRLLAERLAQRWGQPVVIENRQGGDGIPAVTTSSLRVTPTCCCCRSPASSPSIHCCTSACRTIRPRTSSRSFRWPIISLVQR